MRKNKTLPGTIKPVPGRLAGKIAVVTGGARGIGAVADDAHAQADAEPAARPKRFVLM